MSNHLETDVLVHVRRQNDQYTAEWNTDKEAMKMLGGWGLTVEQAVGDLVTQTGYPSTMKPRYKLMPAKTSGQCFTMYVRQRAGGGWEASLDQEWRWLTSAGSTPEEADQRLRAKAKGLDIKLGWTAVESDDPFVTSDTLSSGHEAPTRLETATPLAPATPAIVRSYGARPGRVSRSVSI